MSSLAAIQFAVAIFTLIVANIVLGLIRYIYYRVREVYFLKHRIHLWAHDYLTWFNISDPGKPEFPPYDKSRLPYSVQANIGVFTYIIGSVTAAALIGISLLISQLGSIEPDCITEQLQVHLASVPIVPVVYLMLLGAAGLACSALFVVTPGSWTNVRRVLAMTIVLVALCLAIFFWVILYQIIALVEIRAEYPCRS